MAGFGGYCGKQRAKLALMNVVLGITGSIAAYKTPELVRRLRDHGADVQIVMTASAEEFVTSTALQAVSGKPIRSNLWDKEAEASMSHIALGRRCADSAGYGRDHGASRRWSRVGPANHLVPGH